jgi:hypothetical protein
LDRRPCARDGGVERGAFGFVETIAGAVDNEIVVRVARGPGRT